MRFQKLMAEKDQEAIAHVRSRCRIYLDNNHGKLSLAKLAGIKGGFAPPHKVWVSVLMEWLKAKEKTMTHKPDEEIPDRSGDLRWTEILAEVCPHDKKLTKGECIRCHGRIDRKYRKAFKAAQPSLL